MDVKSLKASIVSKQLDKFYIFAGEEWKIQQIYVDQIVKASGKEYQYVEEFSKIYPKLTNRSFVKKNYVYVIRDDNELLTNEKLQDNLFQLLGDNILILLLSAVDKRTKFYKKFSGNIIVFEPLSLPVLQKYLSEYNLTDENSSKLAQICDFNYGRILLELDKLKRVNLGEICDFNIAFERLLRAGLIYIPPKDAIFEFVDAILDGKVVSTFTLYEECKKVNEATMVMLTVLYNNAKTVLQVQSYEGSNLEKGTGLTQFQIINAKKHINKRSNGDLIFIMEQCQQAQEDIVLGKVEECLVMDHILTEIM